TRCRSLPSRRGTVGAVPTRDRGLVGPLPWLRASGLRDPARAARRPLPGPRGLAAGGHLPLLPRPRAALLQRVRAGRRGPHAGPVPRQRALVLAGGLVPVPARGRGRGAA